MQAVAMELDAWDSSAQLELRLWNSANSCGVLSVALGAASCEQN